MSRRALFADRRDAGRRLAAELAPYRDLRPVIVALPRGGVPVAYEVARALGAPLHLLVARKLGAPEQPELGLGAVAPGGITVLDHELIENLGLTETDVEGLVERERAEMQRRLERYGSRNSLPPVGGRTVLLVDDGLATGGSATAAARALRTRTPSRIVLAVPVCARETALALEAEVDDLVCIALPERFVAVGTWYDHFAQTTDDEVADLVEQARRFAPADEARDR